MTNTDYASIAEKAMQLKHGGFNCCQAVALALINETNLDVETLRNITAGFGAGMGTTDNTCGALVGAGIIAGLKTEGRSSIRFSAAISREFREKCGSTICRELKGLDTGKVLCPCDECVKNAVLAFGKVFD